MNKALLKSIMVMYGDTVKDLGQFLGISRQSVYNKMNETEMPSGKKAEFGQKEIKKIRDRYKLTAKQVEEIFFKH